MDERFGWGSRDIEHFKIRMERRKMQGHVKAEIVQEPVAESRNFVLRIIVARNQQSSHLKPDAGLGFQPGQSVKHRLQFAEAKIMIKISGQRLEINDRRVHLCVKFRTW